MYLLLLLAGDFWGVACGYGLVPVCADVASSMLCGVVVGGVGSIDVSDWCMRVASVGDGVCCMVRGSSALQLRTEFTIYRVKSERTKSGRVKGTCVHNRA
jgi:hypothetical protein